MPIKSSRRTAIKSLSTLGGAVALKGLSLPAYGASKKPVRLGVIADLHGGLAVDAMQRLDAFLAAMEAAQPDALVQLGDFAFPNAKHQVYADKFNAAHKETIHVIGNHEFDFGLSRQDCYQAWSIQNSYYRQDLDDIRILVLDGNDTGSPTHKGGYPSYIGTQQLDWLKAELEQAAKPLLILCHQPLAGRSAINNATEIQQLLGKYHSKILLCLNGHSHVDSFHKIGDVPYLHINSASYYWVGGEIRMTYYQDPLFTLVTIDPESRSIEIAGVESQWKDRSPKAIGYFDRENAPPKASSPLKSEHVTSFSSIQKQIQDRARADQQSHQAPPPRIRRLRPNHERLRDYRFPVFLSVLIGVIRGQAIWTIDRDFSRFSTLNVRNPLL